MLTALSFIYFLCGHSYLKLILCNVDVCVLKIFTCSELSIGHCKMLLCLSKIILLSIHELTGMVSSYHQEYHRRRTHSLIIGFRVSMQHLSKVSFRAGKRFVLDEEILLKMLSSL